MNKKNIIVIVVITISILLILGGYFLLTAGISTTPSPKTSDVSPQNNNIATEPTYDHTQNLDTSPKNASKLSIPTTHNTILSVKNFYQDPETQIFDADKDAVIKDEPQYKILYYTVDHSFFIFLLGGNLHTARNTAEQELLKKLNTTESQACDLRVSVLIDRDAGVNDSGMDYKLSFCPNGKPLLQ